jgi:hypothetical protein
MYNKWGKRNPSYINNVCKLQKRIAKIILQQPQISLSMKIFKALDWLPCLDRCKYHTAVLVFKTSNTMAPTYMTELMTIRQQNIIIA